MSAETLELPAYYNLRHVNDAAVSVLRNRRVQCGYDIEELANFSRIPPDRIRDIEVQVSPVTAAELYALGKVLGFSIEVFFVMLTDTE